MKEFETKSLKFDLKDLAEDGSFSGYASVFGNVDLGGEIVMKGAFKRTIDHKGGAVPVLWYHDPTEPIGIGVEMREDDIGLFVKAQLDLDTQQGRDAYSRMKKKIVKGLSIGYRVVADSIENGKRILKELDLIEYSVVTFAMNPLAMITGVKAGRMLSAKNREIIVSAMDSMAATTATLQAMLDEMDSMMAAAPGKSHSPTSSDPEDLHSLNQMLEKLAADMRA